MEIYIFRHGHTNATKNNIEYGDEIFTAPILLEFIPSLEKMADFLKSISSQVHFSSEFLRCRQTVEVITRVTGKKFKFDSRLNEYTPNETLADISLRVSDFIRDLKEYKNSVIMICSHGAIISALANLISDNKLTEKDMLNIPLPGTVWRISDKIEEVFKI